MDDSSSNERRRHDRGSARTARRVPLRYRLEGATAWHTTETLNISVGGAFLAAVELERGIELEIEVDLPSRRKPLRLAGEVRWCSDGTSGYPCGVGIQFFDLDIDLSLELNRYLVTIPETPRPAGT